MHGYALTVTIIHQSPLPAVEIRDVAVSDYILRHAAIMCRQVDIERESRAQAVRVRPSGVGLHK